MAFVKVAEAAALQPGGSMIIVAGSRELALFNVEGIFYCLDNECPHAGGPLGEGYLDGDEVMCPWHAWSFNVRTGELVHSPTFCIGTHACKVEDGAVLVEI